MWLFSTLFVCVLVNFCTASTSLLDDSSDAKNTSLLYNQVIIRHRNRDDSDKNLFVDGGPLKYCRKPAKCQSLKNYTTCMGSKLPYSGTTLELTDLVGYEQVQEKLHLFRFLRYVPKCWSVIQPFLCALYMPKCENGKVDLPSREMCRITLGPCSNFRNTSIFPNFLDCDDERIFPSRCKNDVHDVKFNTTGFCLEPLVETDHSDWFYADVEGCGLRCRDSLYTQHEHYHIHSMIAYCVLICSTLSIFTIVTLRINWHTTNKYPPTLAIFYMNVCFFVMCIGWAIQFVGSETREAIVCKKDGTPRKSEPSASENLSCVIVFVLVYYFLVAGMVWCVIFSYTWYMSSLQAVGKNRVRVEKKIAYFHLAAWSLPLILTIITMAVGEIDADYVTGICFVGAVDSAARGGLLLAPLLAATAIVTYFNIRGMILLGKVMRDSRKLIPEHKKREVATNEEHPSRKIRSKIVKVGVFTLLIVVFSLTTFVYHCYVFLHTFAWKRSLHEFIMCKLTSFSTDFSHCKQESRPSVAMLQLQLLALFGAGIAMASWVWCDATLHSWPRYIRRKFRCEVEEPIKMRKHKIIAQLYQDRDKFDRDERISIPCRIDTDPGGLHIDLNSAASSIVSLSWLAKLPYMLVRRGAIVTLGEANSTSNGVGKGYDTSIDSEVSLNVRQLSIGSRCNSGDSQLSVQFAELKARRKLKSRKNPHRLNKRHERRQSRRPRSKTGSEGTRERSASLDSHVKLIDALTGGGAAVAKNLGGGPNLGRRMANAGLDGQNITKLLSNNKLVIPYSHKNEESDDCEEEELTISQSQINIVVNSTNFGLTDQLVLNSLRQGTTQIEELFSSTDSEEERNKSRSSRRSKRSKSRKHVESNSNDSEDSSNPELKQLL